MLLGLAAINLYSLSAAVPATKPHLQHNAGKILLPRVLNPDHPTLDMSLLSLVSHAHLRFARRCEQRLGPSL